MLYFYHMMSPNDTFLLCGWKDKTVKVLTLLNEGNFDFLMLYHTYSDFETIQCIFTFKPFIFFSVLIMLWSRPFTSASRPSASSTTTLLSWSTACGTPECFTPTTLVWRLTKTFCSGAKCHGGGHASASSITPPSWASPSTFTGGWVTVFYAVLTHVP